LPHFVLILYFLLNLNPAPFPEKIKTRTLTSAAKIYSNKADFEIVQPTMEAEAQLLARCRRGEADAWDELFTRHYAVAGRFVFQLASDFTPEDVEEVCQEVFLSVIRNLHSFQGESQFQTWLFRIATNRARDFRDKKNAAKRGGGQLSLSLQAEDPETGLTIDPPSPAPAPDVDLLNVERAELVRDALEQVGEPCREIIELRYFGDLSYEELSRELELNPKTVSSRLSKCLDKLEGITRKIFSGEKNPAIPSNL
jgi:RNA polymerase sigma-70 factor (ECF subfamily)